jgi:hypothetical protein
MLAAQVNACKYDQLIEDHTVFGFDLRLDLAFGVSASARRFFLSGFVADR